MIHSDHHQLHIGPLHILQYTSYKYHPNFILKSLNYMQKYITQVQCQTGPVSGAARVDHIPTIAIHKSYKIMTTKL